jgi:hypothetical protein
MAIIVIATAIDSMVKKTIAAPTARRSRRDSGGGSAIDWKSIAFSVDITRNPSGRVSGMAIVGLLGGGLSLAAVSIISRHRRRFLGRVFCGASWNSSRGLPASRPRSRADSSADFSGGGGYRRNPPPAYRGRTIHDGGFLRVSGRDSRRRFLEGSIDDALFDPNLRKRMLTVYLCYNSEVASDRSAMAFFIMPEYLAWGLTGSLRQLLTTLAKQGD